MYVGLAMLSTLASHVFAQAIFVNCVIHVFDLAMLLPRLFLFIVPVRYWAGLCYQL